jgi:ornithine cyclodeaminase/alanine dehydrogenase-like protein (mu-crystallin family)
VTCTPSRAPFLHKVQPGTFVAAVGADSEEKSEIAPDLMASSKVVTDVTEQCRTIGDLHHAPDAEVYAELSEIVAGRKGGREREDETIVFDSTGMALQDVAAAAIVYDRAVAAGRGTHIDFGAF